LWLGGDREPNGQERDGLGDPQLAPMFGVEATAPFSLKGVLHSEPRFAAIDCRIVPPFGNLDCADRCNRSALYRNLRGLLADWCNAGCQVRCRDQHVSSRFRSKNPEREQLRRPGRSQFELSLGTQQPTPGGRWKLTEIAATSLITAG